MDGFETARIIRQKPQIRHIPIIFTTAAQTELERSRGYELGAADYLFTPIVPEVLRDKGCGEAEGGGIVGGLIRGGKKWVMHLHLMRNF